MLDNKPSVGREQVTAKETNLERVTPRVDTNRSFLQAEARILAEMHLDEISLDHGQKLIGDLQRKSNGLQEFSRPNGIQLISEDVTSLQNRHAIARSYFTNLSPEIQAELSQVCLSGRGLNDFNATINQKHGSYPYAGQKGSGIMVWSLIDRGNFNQHTLAGLKETGYKAYTYTCLTNKERMKIDPEPGGVIALRNNLQTMMDGKITLEQAASSSIEIDRPSAVGRCTIPLIPENFDESFITGIPFSAVRDMHTALHRINNQQANLHNQSTNESLTNEEQTRLQFADIELYARQMLTKQFIGLTIMNKIVLALQA